MAAPSANLTRYVPARFPQLNDSLRTFLTNELAKIAEAIIRLKAALTLTDTVATPLVAAVDDVAAAAAGVQVNQLYHNAGAVRSRLV